MTARPRMKHLILIQTSQRLQVWICIKIAPKERLKEKDENITSTTLPFDCSTNPSPQSLTHGKLFIILWLDSFCGFTLYAMWHLQLYNWRLISNFWFPSATSADFRPYYFSWRVVVKLWLQSTFRPDHCNKSEHSNGNCFLHTYILDMGQWQVLTIPLSTGIMHTKMSIIL